MKKEGNKDLLSLEILSLIPHFLPRIALEGIFILTGVNSEVHRGMETSWDVTATQSQDWVWHPDSSAHSLGVALHRHSEGWLWSQRNPAANSHQLLPVNLGKLFHFFLSLSSFLSYWRIDLVGLK